MVHLHEQSTFHSLRSVQPPLSVIFIVPRMNGTLSAFSLHISQETDVVWVQETSPLSTHCCITIGCHVLSACRGREWLSHDCFPAPSPGGRSARSWANRGVWHVQNHRNWRNYDAKQLPIVWVKPDHFPHKVISLELSHLGNRLRCCANSNDLNYCPTVWLLFKSCFPTKSVPGHTGEMSFKIVLAIGLCIKPQSDGHSLCYFPTHPKWWDDV